MRKKIVIHLSDTSSTSEEQLVTLTVFVSTGRILIQGKKYKEWCTAEFPVLLEIVNKVQSAPSISNFFGKIITFISEDEIHTSQSTKDTTIDATETTAATPNMSRAPPSVEPLSVSPSKLNTLSAMRDTVGNLEAEFTQFQIVSSGDIQQLKEKNCSARQLTKIAKEDNR